jgi:protein CpxP
MIQRIVDRLDLTDDQRAQMKQIHIEPREETETLREQMSAAHDRLAALIDAEQFDETAIREAAAQFAEYQTELFVSRAAVQQELREILTPEQFEQMKEMREKHHGAMMRHGGGHKGGRPHHGRNQPAPEEG